MIKYASYSLLKQNTFGIDVKADWFVEYRNVEELTEVLRQEEMRKLPLLHIGGGSNLLFMSDFHGLVLHSGIKGIEVVDENATEVLVRVGAGVIWDDFVLHAIEHDWHGIEKLIHHTGRSRCFCHTEYRSLWCRGKRCDRKGGNHRSEKSFSFYFYQCRMSLCLS